VPMQRVLVLGAGFQGASIVKSLSSLESVGQITAVDIEPSRLRGLAGVPRTVTVEADVREKAKLDALLRSHDLVSGALPSELGFQVMEEAASIGVNMVDTSFMPQDPLVLDELARKNEVCIVPDCGVAPGLSHILVGNYLKKLGRAKEIHILVGGLPQVPRPPLEYSVTWSVQDLIEEYTRPARIVRNRAIITVDPLSEPTVLDLPVLGKLESFYTDGLRTLLRTAPPFGVECMDERTLRYPGHVEKIRVLRDTGLFSQELVSIGACKVSPRDFTARVLSRVLTHAGERDMTILLVNVSSAEAGKRIALEAQVVDYYDEKTQLSSMARTTGLTNVAVCSLLLNGLLKEKGVFPPEMLGMNRDYFDPIVSYLRGRGIHLAERICNEGPD